ncbi:MAG: type III-B CRISPR module-associated protein Cmr5 [Thermoanaerobacterium thermosaccharolyticum]|jgi:CRISPR-associated protein Cmr5
MSEQTMINKLEKGRAEFAYNCVSDAKKLRSNNGNVEKVLNEFLETIRNNIGKNADVDEKQKLLERFDQIFKEPDKYIVKENFANLEDDIKKALEKYSKFLENYRSYARKIPTMILTNGLGQTVAFVRSKFEKETAYKLLYTQITEYIKSSCTSRITMPQEKNDLVEWVISCNSTEYRYITSEVLAFLNWLRRLAEGLIEK